MMPINSHEFVYIPNQRFLLDKMTWKVLLSTIPWYNIGKQKTQNFVLYVWSLTLLTYLSGNFIKHKPLISEEFSMML